MSTVTLPAGNAGAGAASGASGMKFLIGLAGAVIAGALVIWQLMTQGHAAFNATSLGLMWGLPIVTYDFFLMSSCGAALVATLGTVLGVKGITPLARRATWVAFALLVGGVAALMLELGHPLRSLYAIPLNLQFKAPLFWKVIGVAVYGLTLLALAAGWLAKPQAAGPPGLASKVNALAALAVVITGGLMFATLSMRPFWHSGEVPVMVLVEALLGGLAFTLLAADSSSNDEVGAAAAATRGMAALTFLALLFVLGRAIVGLASNLDGLQVWNHVVASPPFWIQLAALVVALWLTASGAAAANGGMRMAAAVLVLVGLFSAKYEFVIGGQLVPLFKGTWARGLIDYSPSSTEWLLLVMSAFLAYAVYAFGAARFRLGAAR